MNVPVQEVVLAHEPVTDPLPQVASETDPVTEPLLETFPLAAPALQVPALDTVVLRQYSTPMVYVQAPGIVPAVGVWHTVQSPA